MGGTFVVSGRVLPAAEQVAQSKQADPDVVTIRQRLWGGHLTATSVSVWMLV